jgi:hypothetical protein
MDGFGLCYWSDVCTILFNCFCAVRVLHQLADHSPYQALHLGRLFLTLLDILMDGEHTQTVLEL